MTLYLILFLIIFPFSVGLLYGAVGRLVSGWLKRRGWQVRDNDEERFAWEPEYNYNLPPSDEWLTLWQAYREQRRLGKNRSR